MDIAVASEQNDRLRVVTADDCTLADLSALQGYWTQAQYLKLTNEGNCLIEFTDGRIEFLPIPGTRRVPSRSGRPFGGAARFLGQRPGVIRRGAGA